MQEVCSVISLPTQKPLKKLLNSYESEAPEIVFHWKDKETEAQGWLVINSLRGGAAGGGTRMRKGLDLNEVISLAKTMEIKFAISGPSIGGAKSGIDFDPNDPRKEGVLNRWFKVVSPILKNYYGTGGDLNIDEVKEVIPVLEEMGVLHPQEGICNGHFESITENKINRIDQLRQGVVKVIENETYSPDVKSKYTVADMITGYGVAEAVKHYYQIYGGELEGKKAVIQGFGNVGASAAFFLSKMGVKIVGIIDIVGGMINEKGFSPDEIKTFLGNRKEGKPLSVDMISFDVTNEYIWNVPMDIFVPCAASRLIQKDHIVDMIAAGLEVISCGANVPFADQEIFYGTIMEYTDKHISLIPDFISNCGMARAFAYFMEDKVSLEDEMIFSDISKTIQKALMEIYQTNQSINDISCTAFEISLKKISGDQSEKEVNMFL